MIYEQCFECYNYCQRWMASPSDFIQ